MSLEDDVKGWLASKTVWGGIIAAASAVAGTFFKLEFPADFTAQLATEITTLVGAAIAIFGRIRAVKKIK